VAGFHEISNHFFNFLWDASEKISIESAAL